MKNLHEKSYQIYGKYHCKRLHKEVNYDSSTREDVVSSTPWVCHPNKPGKIRMVVDLSAGYKVTCLNKELPGPDLTNQIIGVLLRVREEHVGVIGDIEATFHQVKIPDTQFSFLKFFLVAR